MAQFIEQVKLLARYNGVHDPLLGYELARDYMITVTHEVEPNEEGQVFSAEFVSSFHPLPKLWYYSIDHLLKDWKTEDDELVKQIFA